MKRKNIIIAIVAVVVLLALAGAYLQLNNSGEKKTSTLLLGDRAAIEAPETTNFTQDSDKNGIFTYVDKENQINITCCSNGSTEDGFKKMKSLKNSIEVGAKNINENNVFIYLKDGVYSAFIKNVDTKDTILIQSPNKNTLLNCLGTIKYIDGKSSFKIDKSNTNVVNVTKTTETAVSKYNPTRSSSSSSSSVSSSSSSSYNSYSGRSISDAYGGGRSYSSSKSSGSSSKSSSSSGGGYSGSSISDAYG
jgi:hypothetical protein